MLMFFALWGLFFKIVNFNLVFFGRFLSVVDYLTSNEVQISSTVRFRVSSAMSCP
jgi:hypothetical protein